MSNLAENRRKKLLDQPKISLVDMVWRGARVADSACLESTCTGNGTMGSNPILSAISLITNRNDSPQRVIYGSKFKPWKLISFVGFSEASKAVEFERYLKPGSGRASARKRLL